MPSRLISFKDNDAENKLLKEVDKAYNKSAFVKECIEFYLAHKDMNFYTPTKDTISNESEIDNLDWEF